MRKKVKGKLYYLAREAKARMRNYNKERSIFEQIPYMKACLTSQEQELYKRVCKLLSSEQIVINPIQELVDRKYYNTLSLDAKQKYIFDLTEKYKQMKLRFEAEQASYAKVQNL